MDLRDTLRSPDLAGLWALLSTLCAALSYTSFLTTTNNNDDLFLLVIACLVGISLATTFLPVLAAPLAMRAHPRVRTAKPNLFFAAFLITLTMFTGIFLSNIHVRGHRLDVYSVLSVGSFVAAVLFRELALLPGYKYMLPQFILGVLFRVLSRIVGADALGLLCLCLYFLLVVLVLFLQEKIVHGPPPPLADAVKVTTCSSKE